MKIHLTGASGVGVTTLGEFLSKRLGYPYFDTDKYYWEPSNPPFTVRRNPCDRDSSIAEDLSEHQRWILGGSIINWGEKWLTEFNLVVFLWIPSSVRIERLKKRELERYGEVIFSDSERNQQYNDFIGWASGYDTNTARGRTLSAHQEWLRKLSCPIVMLEGDLSVEHRADKITDKMKNLAVTTRHYSD